ncbi:hypothetical protein NXV31_23500 [Bacteroides fragilis]|nr:hypothetical protein [Bacteroides fragilis]
MRHRVNRTEKITFRAPREKAALAEQATRCGISTSELLQTTLALGGRPKERYTEEERELFREMGRLKGTLQRLNNYFGGRQYGEVFEENQALINELKKMLHDVAKGKSISHGTRSTGVRPCQRDKRRRQPPRYTAMSFSAAQAKKWCRR